MPVCWGENVTWGRTDRQTDLGDFRIEFYVQVFSSSFHDYYISKYGCNIPFFGGLKVSKDNKNPLCINTSLYDVDMVDKTFQTFFDKMKIPCKASETYYGVPIIEHAENATM